MRDLIRISPISALGFLLAGLSMAAVLGAATANLGIAGALTSVVYLAWPYLVAARIRTPFNSSNLAAGAIWASVAVLNFFASSISSALSVASFPVREILSCVWIYGTLAPLYIMWIGSKTLVSAEERSVAAANRCIGTFFLFFFLPVGIWFIQRRVRQLPQDGLDEAHQFSGQ